MCVESEKELSGLWGTLFVYPFLGVFFPGPDVDLVQAGGTLSDGESLTSPGPHSKSQMRCVSGSLIFPRLNALPCPWAWQMVAHTPFVCAGVGQAWGWRGRRHRLDVRTRYPCF